MIFQRTGALVDFHTHGLNIGILKAKGLQVGETPISVTKTRFEIDSLPVGRDGLLLLANSF